MYDKEKASRSIKAARVAAGIKQSEMAEKLGVTQVALSNWETGKSVPNVSYMLDMSEMLGMTVERLVGKS